MPFGNVDEYKHLKKKILIPSGGAGGEQQRAGRVRDRCGAAGQGAAGAPLCP